MVGVATAVDVVSEELSIKSEYIVTILIIWRIYVAAKIASITKIITRQHNHGIMIVLREEIRMGGVVVWGTTYYLMVIRMRLLRINDFII